MMLGYLAVGLVALISWLVQSRFRSRFEKYSQIGIQSRLTGREIAEEMLRDNGIYDVKIVAGSGMLTDHYDPSSKTVSLSESVYSSTSVAAAAVAAHECGHAVQHAKSYSGLQLRSGLVPVTNICNKVLMFANMGFFLLAGMSGGLGSLLITVVLLANVGVTLFSLITLPVEFDASRRALAWIETKGVVNNTELADAKDALWWAAMTYVVGALGALANLFYWFMIFLNRRNANN
jgi:uncharacterized protein